MLLEEGCSDEGSLLGAGFFFIRKECTLVSF